MLKVQDLQVAKLSGTAFPMAHKMGLANIKMAGSTASASKTTLTLSANTTTTEYSTSATANAYYALDEFVTNLPYKVGTRNTSTLSCYFIVNPSKSYTFSTSYKYGDNDVYSQWNNITVNSTNNTVTKGQYKEIKTSAPKFKNLARLYYCTKGVQSFSPIYTCKHKLEAWGAQGSLYYPPNPGGKGGYTYGYTTLTSNVDIYVYVGECNNEVAKKGYNTGYTTGTSGLSGGGASHIAKSNKGELYNYESYKTDIYIVAGGGGGGEYGIGGAGGGTTGQNSTYATGGSTSGGSSQTGGGWTNGSFGRGGQAWSSTGDYGDGGGGGWYGGGGGMNTPGAGGSGHVGSVDSGETIQGTVANKIPSATASSGYETGHANDGNARITIMPYD